MKQVKNNSNELVDMMRNLLALSKDRLSVDDLKQATHFLDHNEAGIAFQELCGAIVEENVLISSEMKALIQALYLKMDGESDPFWKQIKLKEHIEAMKTG